MRNSLAGQLKVTVGQIGNPADMVDTVNVLTNLHKTYPTGASIKSYRPLTFDIVRSQLGSIRLAMLIKARGTVQSYTSGGLG